MVPVLRGLVIYLFLLGLFRVAGKRTLAEVTIFDFVLLLIISEATQQGMIGNDFSITNSVLLVLTLVTLERISDWIAKRSRRVDRVLNDTPTIVVENGRLVEEWAKRYQLTAAQVLEQARKTQGVERLDQIKYAVLERDGDISVIPRGSGDSA
jgi:uncharacterized membrane protein YcaP (DUF421 family)